MKGQQTVHKLAIMVVCIVVTVFSLNGYAQLIQHLISIHYDWKFELCMVGGQLLFQLPFIYKRPPDLKMDYFLNMLLVSFTGALLLLPLLAINHFYPLGTVIHLTYFFAVVLFMFFNHKKRVKDLALPACISYSWVLYRFLILIFILI